MKIKTENLLNIHLPRWEELPTFDLYIDQVIGFISEHLSVFNHGDEPLITASMINNYVKNGVLHPAVKKKYNREHLAKLMVVCIGKRMLSISDVKESINAMMRVFSVAEGYNIFCDELEYEIFSTVCPEKYPPKTIDSISTHDSAIVHLLASSVARILIFDKIVGQRKRLSELTYKLLNQ